MHPASERPGHYLCYDPILVSHNTYKYSFFIWMIPIWNRLPLEAMTAPSTKIFQTVVLPAMQLTNRSSGLLSQLNCFHLYYLLLYKVHLHICEHQVCSPWTNSALLGVVSTLKTEDNTVSIVAQDTWYRLVSCLVFPPSFLPPSQRNIDLATYDQSH